MIDKPDSQEELQSWWRTSIIDMKPGKIALHGHPIQSLIGNVSFPQMIWMMLRGFLPSAEKAALLEAALVAGVDHGPQAPSIAAARMASTCGVGINNALASAVNMLGDVHGGAGESCAQLYYKIARLKSEGNKLNEAINIGLDIWQTEYGKYIPGFGHRFHKPVDPRAPRLMVLVRDAVLEGTVTGQYADIGEGIQAEIHRRKGSSIAMNIDGATAVIFCELGFEPQLSRGLFCLSRSVGILAHSWEQMNQGGRNKGPMPPEYLPKYEVKNTIGQ